MPVEFPVQEHRPLAEKKFKKQPGAIPVYSCQIAISLIAEYLSGCLEQESLRVFEAHLATCPDCTAFLRTYKKTIEATQAFLQVQSTPNNEPHLILRPKPANQ